MYADVESLYRTTIDENPDCWMARSNLGIVLTARGEIGEAKAQLLRSLELNPRFAQAHTNLGIVFMLQNRPEEAVQEYREALAINPDYTMARNNLGEVLRSQGKLAEAIAQFRQVLAIRPNDADVHYNLGVALTNEGCLGEAVEQYRRALEIKPNYTVARQNLDAVLSRRKEILNALSERREMLRVRPNDVVLLNATAWLLATDCDASVRNGAEAVSLAQQAAQISGSREPAILGTLAAAYAEAGRFPEAVQTARKAIELAVQRNDQPLAETLRARLALYEAGKPFRQTLSTSPPPRPRP